jgi:hypothetical protein
MFKANKSIRDGILTSNEHLLTGTLLNEGGSFSVDRSVLVSQDGTFLIDGLTDNVDDSAESLGTDGHHDGVSGVSDGLSTNEALSGVESDGADVVATQMLGDLEDEAVRSSLYLKGIENRGKLTFELHVDDGTNNLRNFSVCLVGGCETTYSIEHRSDIGKSWFARKWP